mmetsp:Transcript_2819/g.6860  ORF Transcript_2819/g.6860 Transcript_2819/m.6860 type:complete len:222 (+) Transcript_2819:3945-4610(+)
MPAGRHRADEGKRVQHLHRKSQGLRPCRACLLPCGRRFPHEAAHVPLTGELLHHRLVRGVAGGGPVQRGQAANDIRGLATTQLGGHAQSLQGGPPICRGGCKEGPRHRQALHLHYTDFLFGVDQLLQEGSRHAPRPRGHAADPLAEGSRRPGGGSVCGGEHGKRHQGKAARLGADQQGCGCDDGRYHRGQGEGGSDQGELRQGGDRGSGTGAGGQCHQGGR